MHLECHFGDIYRLRYRYMNWSYRVLQIIIVIFASSTKNFRFGTEISLLSRLPKKKIYLYYSSPLGHFEIIIVYVVPTPESRQAAPPLHSTPPKKYHLNLLNFTIMYTYRQVNYISQDLFPPQFVKEFVQTNDDEFSMSYSKVPLHTKFTCVSHFLSSSAHIRDQRRA